MLIGYPGVTKVDGSRSPDLRRDAPIGAGVDASRISIDHASAKRDDRPGLDARLETLRGRARVAAFTGLTVMLPTVNVRTAPAAAPSCAGVAIPAAAAGRRGGDTGEDAAMPALALATAPARPAAPERARSLPR